MKYEVMGHINITVNVEAENEKEAVTKATETLKNLNGILKPDSCDVKLVEE